MSFYVWIVLIALSCNFFCSCESVGKAYCKNPYYGKCYGMAQTCPPGCPKLHEVDCRSYRPYCVRSRLDTTLPSVGKMPVGSSRRKRPRRSSSAVPPPMSSSPAMRPKAAFAALDYKTHLRRAVSLPCALVALCLLLLLYATWKIATFRLFPAPPLPPSPPPKFYSFDVINEFPHDPDAFTQGLLYGGNETLFESTGNYGKSSVRQVLLQTGKVLFYHKMDESLFGEGLTLLGERLFQVTWLTNIGFTYDRHNFSKLDKFTHQMHDGWGLATDGQVIFGSDGSSTLYQLDPKTLKVIQKVSVRYNGREVPRLNELEYVNGEVWANIWQTDCIARISHEDGTVQSWILLHELRQGLLRSGYRDIDVLNGIAWDEEKRRLFVTGKWWPKLYEIKLRPVSGPLNDRIEDLCPLRAY